MNLIVDIGNTIAKIAVFQKDEMLQRQLSKSSGLHEKVSEVFSKFPGISAVVVSNVAKMPFAFPAALKKDVRVLDLNADTPLPFKNLYASPRTLGNDRKAVVAAAVQQFPDEHVLIIDAGTCITYDFKNSDNDYLGGGISPGLQIRFKALNYFTANLPLVDVGKETRFIGDNTENSIRSGVVFGILKEIDGMIEEYSKKYPGIRVIITGGDAQFLSVNLKNSIFANSNFLLEGLNYILKFNNSQ